MLGEGGYLIDLVLLHCICNIASFVGILRISLA